jgi:hypothetical protein
MDTMEENWLPVVGYENYEVSDLGRVKNIKTGKILKPTIRKDGYCLTSLGRKNQYLVHRLILLTFLPNDEMEAVNHKNHNKTDNRLCNLEWCSHSENNRFKKKRGGLTSKYVGVCWDKNRNKWDSKCSFNNKTIHFGRFDDEREAAKAYNEFIIKHNLQDFAILNDLTRKLC